MPVPFESAIRFGTWTQVYGDYEKRSATGSQNLVNDTGAIFGGGIVSVQSRTGTVGFLAGADLTSRLFLAVTD